MVLPPSIIIVNRCKVSMLGKCAYHQIYKDYDKNEIKKKKK